MRHIPEEELHAYLDQALSRSQCVEIERHLARCSRCQRERDSIAGLRDRTTALLARLGPPPIIAPAFAALQDRHAVRLRRRRQGILVAGWAASIAGALLLGWQVDARFHHPTAAVAAPSIAVSPAPSPSASPDAPSPTRLPVGAPAPAGAPAPLAEAPRRLVRVAKHPGEEATAARFAKTSEADASEAPHQAPDGGARYALANADAPEISAAPVGADPGLQGIWRTILPDSSTGAEPAGDVAKVPGLPIVQFRVQPGDGGTEVTAVDQLLESGEVIRTIAGPAVRVGSLVARESASQSPAQTEGTDGRMTVTIRQGDRMVAVTGPSQALGTLLSRVNLKRRRY